MVKKNPCPCGRSFCGSCPVGVPEVISAVPTLQPPVPGMVTVGPITLDARLVPDIVNHPPHYTQHPSGVECIQIVEHMSFNIGNAFKYLWRADLKNGRIENLQKAIWYINREIQRLGDST